MLKYLSSEQQRCWSDCRMRRLICALIVRIWQKQVFSWRGSFYAVLIVCILFRFGVLGRMWNSILSVTVHFLFIYLINEPRHDKPTKWVCAQRRLRSAWASIQSDQSSLSAWRKLWSLATHWARSEDSDQTGWMPRLIWVFAGRTLISLVLSCRGSNTFQHPHSYWSSNRAR